MKHYVKLVRPYLVWSMLMVVIPLLLIVIYSVTTGGNTLVNIQFTLTNFKKFAEPIYLQVFIKSFQIGLVTVFFCFLLGYVLAYNICKFSERAQSFMILLVTIPMWINTLLRTYAWISILSDNGIVEYHTGKIRPGSDNLYVYRFCCYHRHDQRFPAVYGYSDLYFTEQNRSFAD